jgi:hypothetical protein
MNQFYIFLFLALLANLVVGKIIYDVYIYFYKKPKKDFYEFNIFQNLLGTGEYNKLIELQKLDS